MTRPVITKLKLTIWILSTVSQFNKFIVLVALFSFHLIENSNLINVSARRKVASKAYEIINRNFTSELQRKEAEIENLDSTLLQVQKALHLVRYAAVSNLYSGPSITGTNGQARKNRCRMLTLEIISAKWSKFWVSGHHCLKIFVLCRSTDVQWGFTIAEGYFCQILVVHWWPRVTFWQTLVEHRWPMVRPRPTLVNPRSPMIPRILVEHRIGVLGDRLSRAYMEA